LAIKFRRFVDFLVLAVDAVVDFRVGLLLEPLLRLWLWLLLPFAFLDGLSSSFNRPSRWALPERRLAPLRKSLLPSMAVMASRNDSLRLSKLRRFNPPPPRPPAVGGDVFFLGRMTKLGDFIVDAFLGGDCVWVSVDDGGATTF